ncbi:MAG TPA: LytTR family DNA-binding domain-containing protein [Chthoniobacteraceae bacterium]|nr:LytTR family DNA-binding domain-containing protein [Chthoniobacteraceae bacterium]
MTTPGQALAASPLATPFRAILLDDNADDRQHFRFLLHRYPSVRLLGEAATFKQALELLDREKANVLFLESEIAGHSILDECPLIPVTVKLIFLTRRPASAVKAFELDAVDFLLKPLFSARFAETVRRLLRIDWKRTDAPPRPPVAANHSVLIPFERGRRGTSLNEISLIQAFGNYTRLTLADGQSEIVLRSLSKWEQTLPMPPFLRVHRNAIVHSQKVTGLEEDAGGGHLLRIDGIRERISISRRCLREVRLALFGVG